MGARRFLPARAFCVKARSWRPCKVVERRAEDDTYTLKWADTHETEVPAPYTLQPTPCNLHPAPYTLHPTPHQQVVNNELSLWGGRCCRGWR